MAKKSFVLSLVALIALLVLTGCSPNQQVLFNASMNMQNAKSLQEHTTLAINFSGTGFDSDAQKQIDQAAAALNNSKLEWDIKTNSNDQKTAAKAQMDLHLNTQGLNLDMPIWVDTDLTGKTPKITEIVKLPQVAKATLPQEFMTKDYMIIDPTEVNNSGLGILNSTNLINSDFQTMELNFLKSYSQRYNPTLNIIDNGIQTIQTNDGPKPARIYEIKLNDSQLKDLIRYTVNNFCNDPEAMNFLQQFMGMFTVPNYGKDLNSTKEFNNSFNQLFNPQSLKNFNAVMDGLNNVTFLGDNGLDLKYAISGNYIVQESGTIDLKLDLAQLTQLMDNLKTAEPSGNQTAPTEVAPVAAKGTLNLQINFNTDISGINTQPKILLPETNSDNSFNFQDLMKNTVKVSETTTK